MQRVDMQASIQFFWGFSKKTLAFRHGLWQSTLGEIIFGIQLMGSRIKNLKSTDLLWHAADAASAGGHSEDGGTVFGVEPS